MLFSCFVQRLYQRVLERATGFEPVTSLWKSDVLPLHHARRPAKGGVRASTSISAHQCYVRPHQRPIVLRR